LPKWPPLQRNSAGYGEWGEQIVSLNDGDGSADYSTSNNYKRYAFWEATEAIKRGITIHTIAVGANADRDMLEAIANASGGVFIDVPGGSTVEEVEEQLSSAFSQIAAKVPAAQLLYEN